MAFFNKALLNVLLAGIATTMVGCGSSNDDTSTKSTLALPGVQYDSPSYQGVISAKGEFPFQSGEVTHFSLAGVDLGQSVVTGDLNILDVFPHTLSNRQVDIQRSLNETHDKDADFRIFMNKLIWLSVLDSDGDANNGFDVRHWNGDVPGHDLNFDTKTAYFFHLDLAENIKTQPIVLSDTATAQQLNTLFKQAGIQIPVQLISQQQRFNNIGEAPTLQQQINYQYDQLGRLTHNAYDGNGNGNSDTVRSYMYNPQGKLSQWTKHTYANSDGVLTEYNIQQWEYNAAGLLINNTRQSGDSESNLNGSGETEARVFNVDGTLNMVNRDVFDGIERTLVRQNKTEYQYQPSNNEVVEIFLENNDGDDDYDTRIVWTTLFNEQGQKTSFRRMLDNNNDNDCDALELKTKEFNDAGLLLQYMQSVYQDCDGTAVQTVKESYEYNDAGQIVYYEYQYDDSPETPDEVTKIKEEIYSYQGASLTQVLSRTDENANGEWVNKQQENFTYDAQGNITVKILLQDRSKDGNWDYKQTTEYQFNDVGLYTNRVIKKDDGNDGQYDSGSRLERQYNDDFQLTLDNSISHLTDEDTPTKVSENTKTYTEYGALLESHSKTDSNGDGEFNSDLSYVYEHVIIEDGVYQLMATALQNRP